MALAAIAPFAPVIGSLISGLFGSGQQSAANKAAEQSAQAQTQIADVMRQIVNTLLQTYGTTFQPLQQQVGQQYQGLAGLPTQDVMKAYVAKMLDPNSAYVNPALRNQAIQSQIQALTEAISQMHQGTQLSEGQQAEQAQRFGEQALQNVSAQNIQFAGQGQQQYNANLANALNALMGGLGSGAQYSALGSNLTGQGIASLGNLNQTYGTAGAAAQQAASASNPWASLGPAVSQAVTKYLQPSAAPSYPPGPADTQQYYAPGYPAPTAA